MKKNLDGPKPYKFIGLGDLHGSKPCKFIGFGDLHGPKAYESIRLETETKHRNADTAKIAWARERKA